ncbi:MAG: 2,3,4,5-tetrahydropyridine-2,6-dicarboxylate N-succinyltransferase [Candidatus Vidania fulgoroideorum]
MKLIKKIKIEVEKNWKKQRNSKYIKKTINLLNKGKIKICKKINKKWKINNWIKKAIILYLKYTKKKYIKNKILCYFDKINNKFTKNNKKELENKNIRLTSLSLARFGSYISKNTILMPCFINIGAYIGKNTLIDSWSTIGSCAYIGKNVHISGGVGIGGVLEPINKKPVIIEKNCFIGARSEIAEGVIIKKNSVISMGVYIGSSTKIFDRCKKKIYKGYIPKNSVVVPGSINKGKYSIYAPIIVKKRNKKTNRKIKINLNLRGKLKK